MEIFKGDSCCFFLCFLSFSAKDVVRGPSFSTECDSFFSELDIALSQLNEQNYSHTYRKILSLQVFTLERIITAVDMIFQKVLNKQNLLPLSTVHFAKLCKDFAAISEQFKVKLAEKCENIFANEILRKQMLPKFDETAKNSLDRQVCELQQLEIYLSNRRCNIIIKFFGELYVEKTLGIQTLVYFLDALIEQQSHEKLEYLCDLLNTVGGLLECDSNRSLDLRSCDLNKYFSVLKTIIDNSQRNKIDVLLKTKIKNLIKLRELKWEQMANTDATYQPLKLLGSGEAEVLSNGLAGTVSSNLNGLADCSSKFSTLQSDLFWIRNNVRNRYFEIIFKWFFVIF